MLKENLDERLLLACEKATCNLDEIKELVVAGADTNQLNEYGNNIFNGVFLYALYEVYDNDGTDKEKQLAFSNIKNIIEIMVENGWDTERYGLAVLSQFTLSFYDKYVFDIFKFFLKFDLGNDKKAYERLLESIGTEESYQRCCEENHDLENLFFAIYEMVDAKMKGENFKSIDPYYDAIGMTIDRIVYFSESDTTVAKDKFTEFNADIGFVCGNKMLVLRDGINILFMNDRVTEVPQIDISNVFGKNVIGRKIKAISFEHKTIVKGTTHYGQPTIVMELTNGKKIKLTHNFGEMPDNQTQSRFWIE